MTRFGRSIGFLARGFHVTMPAALTCGIVRQIEAVAAEAWSGAEVAII